MPDISHGSCAFLRFRTAVLPGGEDFDKPEPSPQPIQMAQQAGIQPKPNVARRGLLQLPRRRRSRRRKRLRLRHAPEILPASDVSKSSSVSRKQRFCSRLRLLSELRPGPQVARAERGGRLEDQRPRRCPATAVCFSPVLLRLFNKALFSVDVWVSDQVLRLSC